MQWDDAIAATAQSWAAQCPNGHSGTAGVGENMACELRTAAVGHTRCSLGGRGGCTHTGTQ